MEFNFVPKFYREEYFAAPGDFMQIWGEQYAERWTEKAPEENAAKKRRWSR